MANTSAIWQHTDYHLQAAKLKPYQTAYLLTKTIKEFSGKKSGECRQMAAR